jgi:uncharacterized protein (DUF952 family)
MLIYKLFRAGEWADLQAHGETHGAPIDLSDGYVHFSTAAQAAETAAKYFAGVEGLVLLALQSDALGVDLRWEPARGGALFPHLYRVLRMSDILWSAPLPLVDGVHQFPPLG